jgi:hypothetical protein
MPDMKAMKERVWSKSQRILFRNTSRTISNATVSATNPKQLNASFQILTHPIPVQNRIAESNIYASHWPSVRAQPGIFESEISNSVRANYIENILRAQILLNLRSLPSIAQNNRPDV